MIPWSSKNHVQLSATSTFARLLSSPLPVCIGGVASVMLYVSILHNRREGK